MGALHFKIEFTSQNSSKGWGVGVYASTQIGSGQSNKGFTVNANKAKGSSHEIATTHTNTQVTVGGTTVNDIGGNLILDGANLDTKHLTGTVGGDLIVKSRQDAYQYTHDQKQAGFSADVGFDGKPQSFSINGGKTDVDADYAQVTHQSGIKAQESTLSVQGQGKFTGGYLITDAGKNQTQFAQGIQTQDIQNHLNYEGDAISVGIGIGADTSNPDGKAKPALQGIGYGKIDPVNKTSTTHAAITDQAGLSHINTDNFNQQEVQHELNQIITNDFNKEQALTELGAQVNITTEFGKEAPKAVAEFSQYQQDAILSQLHNIEHLSDEQINDILSEAAKWDEGGIYRVALHTAVGAIGTGTIEGAVTTGSVAAAAPTINKLSEQITEHLVKAGISEDTAQNATSLITSLAIATATQSAGVDASSTAMAVNADAFNRQLHANKGEAWVIEELYKRQGGNKKWSREQIANALRAANFRKKASKPGERDFYESADSHNAVPSGKDRLGYDNLAGVQWKHTGTGISLNIPKVDPDLVRYIQSHTGKGDFASYHYTWDSHRLSNYQEPRPERVRMQQAPLVLESELRSRNAAVMNGADLRGASNINHASNQAFKNVLNSAERFHQNYNHVTVLSVSNGGFAQTIIINNLNGKVYMSMPIDVSANVKPLNLGNFQTAGVSAGFGVALSEINSHHKDNESRAAAIDGIIEGASLGVQACYAACLGGSVASGNQVMILYGVGTPGVSLGSSHMVDTGIVLKKSEIARYKSR